MIELRQLRSAVATADELSRRSYASSFTPEVIAQLDIADKSSLTALVISVTSVAMALLIAVVFTRLLIRRRAIGRFFLDDYLVMFASFFTLVVCSVVLTGEKTLNFVLPTRYGLGKHVWNLDLDDIFDELKTCIQLMYVANIFYAAAIAFTKLSIIASYFHIFVPRGFFRWALYTTAAVTIGLGVASIPATIFECIPVSGAWDLTNDANIKCFTFVDFLYATTAINVTTDLILCIAPIPLFWRLQLPVRQRIMISVLFFLGGFACVASIIRLAFLHLLADPIDVTYDLVSSVMWTIAECTIGIVCVSLPPLRSLFARLLPSVFRGGHWPSKSSTTPKSTNNNNKPRSIRSPLSLKYARHHDQFDQELASYRGGQHNRWQQKTVDIVVLSSVTSRRSQSEEEYDLASELGMNRHLGTGVSVTITAGKAAAANANANAKAPGGELVLASAATLATTGSAATTTATTADQQGHRGSRDEHDQMELVSKERASLSSSLPDSEARIESSWDGRHSS